VLRLVAVPEVVAEARVLARYQDGLIRDRTRLINRLLFLLSQYSRTATDPERDPDEIANRP
jgi:hypothetical protein